MAGQRGLHGNLCCFSITHFANHDDVRVLPQDGAQGIGEAQANLLVHLNLVNALQLILDRLFDRDDLVRACVQLGQRGVKRGGFARAGGASD